MNTDDKYAAKKSRIVRRRELEEMVEEDKEIKRNKGKRSRRR